jgi:hypothetical protein
MATKNDKTLWGIHGGKTGDAGNPFLKRAYVPEPLEETEG